MDRLGRELPFYCDCDLGSLGQIGRLLQDMGEYPAVKANDPHDVTGEGGKLKSAQTTLGNVAKIVRKLESAKQIADNEDGSQTVSDVTKVSSSEIEKISDALPEEFEEEHPQEGDDVLDTYGDTVLQHFKKEALEKKHEIFDKPRLFSRRMRMVIIAMEISILATMTLFIIWLGKVREADFSILFAVIGAREASSGARTINLHMTIYVIIFVIILPHVLVLSVVFEFVTTTRLSVITFILKVASFILFFFGLFNIQQEEKTRQLNTESNIQTNQHENQVSEDSEISDEEETINDFKTHFWFARGTVVVFVVYIVITSVRLAGHLFKQIFQIRVIGALLRMIVSNWFVDSVDHLTYGAGYISLLTGFCRFVFVLQPDDSIAFVDSHYRHGSEVEIERWLLRCICILLATLYITILLANFQKHFINNHTHYITCDVFTNVFLRFKNLYEEENVMEMGQDMPKVTSAQRMA